MATRSSSSTNRSFLPDIAVAVMYNCEGPIFVTVEDAGKVERATALTNMIVTYTVSRQKRD